MNYDLKFLLIDYYLLNNYIETIQKLTILDNNFRDIVLNNTLYKRRKSAQLLKNVFNGLGLEYFDIVDLLTPTNTVTNSIRKDPDCLREYKNILVWVSNYYIHGDKSYRNFERNYKDYKLDKFNPLRYQCRISYNLMKRRYKERPILAMAMAHADLNFSIAIAREIDDFY